MTAPLDRTLCLPCPDITACKPSGHIEDESADCFGHTDCSGPDPSDDAEPWRTGACGAGGSDETRGLSNW